MFFQIDVKSLYHVDERGIARPIPRHIIRQRIRPQPVPTGSLIIDGDYNALQADVARDSEGRGAAVPITVVQPDEQLDAVVEAFRSNGGEGKPMYLQVHVAYAPSEAEAREAAFAQWRQNTLPNSVMTDLAPPEQIAAAAQHVTPDDLDGAVRISSDPGRHVEWLRGDLERGFDGLYLHEVGPEQERFVETFGREVLSRLR